MTDLLAHAESVWQSVVADLPTFTVEVLPRIDSTSSELMRRARDGLVEPVLLAAEEQTAGRGRMGKGWHSRAGQSLTFSLALPLAPADWSGLSLAVGLSLVQSLHPRLQLKWPNDVWLDGRKLAGILIETASLGADRYAVIGIGINLVAPDAAGLRTPPAGLRELLPTVQAPDVLEHIAAPLVRAVQRFAEQGFAPLVGAYRERDVLLGQALTCSDGVEGVGQGVDGTGALIVHTAQGLRRINSAEVSVRPAHPPSDS